ncbi:MAG: HAD-IIIA family hydrolase [Phycisphaerae bacterium]|nr:HAD-IIIA family hydrolase [Phycisphaerae bacterium]
MRPAVFLDRDDTLIDTRAVTASTPHPGDLTDPALVRLLSNAAAGCRALAEAGFALVVISNQGAVARGRATLRDVEAVNDRLRALLAAEGVRLDATYYCPFHPGGSAPAFRVEHPWRKPAPGMYLAAAAELELDLARSWAVGDAARDVLSAVTAGIASARAIIVGKGPGIWYPDLAAAAEVICQASRSPAT